MRVPRRSVRFQVLSVLLLKGPLQPVDLKKEVDCSSSTFYRALAKLKREGYIKNANDEFVSKLAVQITMEGIMAESIMELLEDVIKRGDLRANCWIERTIDAN